jgi:hypothetical protein
MKLTPSQRFALDQISRHGVAHSARSTSALARRGLVAPSKTTIGEWLLTATGEEALGNLDRSDLCSWPGCHLEVMPGSPQGQRCSAHWNLGGDV